MRLTLRTMLAYVDEILEPDDAEQIGRKIQESEFATKLVHRTRDCLQRMRLGTPPLMGRGIAMDPNSVAEYLDNTLATERVPEFEKVCLESDVHLAEVAACHQILTLVLGEPAEVDPRSREKMYKIMRRVDQPHPESAAPPPSATPPESAEVQLAPRPKAEVPEYLREPDVPASRRLWVLAATVLVAALLTLGVLAVAGPKGVRSMLARYTGIGKPADQPAAAPADGSDAKKRAQTRDADRVEPAEPRDKSNAGDARPMPPEPDDGSKSDIVKRPADAVTPGDNEPAEPKPGNVTPVAEPADADPPVPMPKANVGGKPANPDEPTGEADAGGDAPGTAKPTKAKPDIGEPGKSPPDTTPPSAKPSEPAPAPAEPGVSKALGRYVSDRDVLARHDPASGEWQRLPAQSSLLAGDRLLALPGFKPTLTLSSGVTIQPIGPALIVMAAPDAQGRPVLGIEYGRVLMLTVGKPGNQVVLNCGQRQAVVTFEDPESTLAIEVGHTLAPGQDPEKASAALAIDLYATSGALRWEDQDEKVELAAPAHQTLSATGHFTAGSAEFPKWISEDVRSDLDRRGAAELEKAMTLDRPIGLSLKELVQRSQREVRALATRCSAYVGKFEPFANALNDPDQKSVWSAHVETLHAALARGPKAAADVRATLQRERGAAAGELYRMLWGYSAEDLQRGDAAKLVEYLDHEHLDYRVLSFWNLQAITGKTLAYRPEYPAARRKLPVQQWKERLKEGKIAPVGPAVRAASGQPRSRPAAVPAGEPSRTDGTAAGAGS